LACVGFDCINVVLEQLANRMDSARTKLV